MKKILILTQAVDKNHPILGFFHGWILAFSEHFSEIHVITLEKGVHELPSHVHVYSLGKEEGESRFKYVWRFYKYFWYIFFTVRVDIVFLHMGAVYNVLGAPFFLIRSLYKTKFIWWKAHGRINRFGRFASIFCDEVVTSTASGFPIASKKRRIVGQAIDTNLFTPDEGVARDSKHILYAGRVSPIKQLEMFIEVAELMEPRGYTFTVVGPTTDEAYLEGLKQQAASTSIKWLEPRPQEELVALYRSAGVFLNTSLTHSMDKTLLEAALCGCIPVTANKAFKEILEPHGLYLSEPSAKAYQTVISALASVDTTALRGELRDHIVGEHSLDTFTNRVFGIE